MDTALPRHAFLSYMHEDKERVDELQEALEAAGIRVWRDTQDLWPGQDWKAQIQEAIKTGSLAFVACFSTAAARREKSHQYEELTLAVDEYRLRPPHKPWLFTVRFDDCEVPDYSLGSGRTLKSTVQYVDLFGQRKSTHLVRLVHAVASVVNPPTPGVAVQAAAATRAAAGTARERADTMKQLLRDPAADIALEDLMKELGTALRERLSDDEIFPVAIEDRTLEAFYPAWREQVDQYEKALGPILEPVRLAAAYGLPQHDAVWARFMAQLTPRIGRAAGVPALTALRGYPALLIMYVAAIAAVERDNYSPLNGFVARPVVRSEFTRVDRIPLSYQVDVRSVVPDVKYLASALALEDAGELVDAAIVEALARRGGGRRTPMSDHLHHFLRGLFEDEFPTSTDYDEAFDRAEILLDAIATDAATQLGLGMGGAGGYGRYTWRHEYAQTPPEAAMRAEAEAPTWLPMSAGLFGASSDRATAALERVVQNAAAYRREDRFA